MNDLMRAELAKRKTRADEAGAKAVAADRLAKAYAKMQREARRDHDGLYDLWLSGVETPPADGQARMWADDPVALAVEEALKELLGEAYRTPAAVAAAEPTADAPVRFTPEEASEMAAGEAAIGEELKAKKPRAKEVEALDLDILPESKTAAIKVAVAELERQAAAIEPTAVASTRTPRTGESDLDRELRSALHNYADAESRWARAIAEGRDDAALMADIGKEFGDYGGASGPYRVGHYQSGGKSPRFWLGDQSGGRKPDLQGAALRDKVRELLGIPRPVAVAEPTAVAQLGTWSTVPLADVVKRPDLLASLKALDLRTLGDLADACDLCGCLANALDDFTPLDAAVVEDDVRTWSRKRPGFPLDKLQLPEDAQAEPDGTALEALHAALYPDGQNPPWRKLANDGAGDDEIRALLATLWPESPEFVEGDRLGDFGYTVRGGDRPAFWVGDAKPNAASMPRPATLLGDALVAAIRRELRLRTPEEIDGSFATPASEIELAKRRRKAKAVAGARP